MVFTMTKETRLNLRITDEFRQQIERLADYHGLKLSSYAHSLLVKGVRRELQQLEETGHVVPERSVTVRPKGQAPYTIELGADAESRGLENTIPGSGIAVVSSGKKMPAAKPRSQEQSHKKQRRA